MYQKTGGAVNIAFGAVLSIWHDYREAGLNDPENAKLPPMEMLEEAARHTDINDVIIDEQASTVFLSDPICCWMWGQSPRVMPPNRLLCILRSRE
jgi:thiamine biosynthesis lipoprotein